VVELGSHIIALDTSREFSMGVNLALRYTNNIDAWNNGLRVNQSQNQQSISLHVGFSIVWNHPTEGF
jgi:hypothetical protein